MKESEKKLKTLRGEIDDLDDRLLALISQRAELAQQIAGVKDGDGGDVYRPDREAEVLRRLAAANPGPLSNDRVIRLFQEVVSACRALEKPMTIAFLGPEGTFTEAAAFKHFGHAVSVTPLESIDAVFREVESGAAQFGVVPVENSTEGVVNHTLDMFIRSGLSICGEVQLRIHHFLMAAQGDRSRIRRVCSHPQSLAQCRKWLDTNLISAERQAVSSNAEAARIAAKDPATAAIAGEVAAELYGLELLARNVEDEPDNTTRFLVIGTQSVARTGNDKTSVMFSAKNRPGALFELLEAFKKRSVNMTRIESRPSRSGIWEYVFFIDVEGHASDENVSAALDDIDAHASFFKVLGSYPRSATG
ncbi:MAG TPA: prephenate dehydratase [Gammaproteobacteria bacterium]|nr:prephenate dehydratase [Gammaproteobacteria bacterium]